MTQKTPSPSRDVQRQISLPLSKALEIAWKNIRLRMSRSMVVTSGIVLALAFLMFILSGDVIVDGMRRWMELAPKSERFGMLEKQQGELQTQIRGLTDKLTAAAAAAEDRCTWSIVPLE